MDLASDFNFSVLFGRLVFEASTIKGGTVLDFKHGQHSPYTPMK